MNFLNDTIISQVVDYTKLGLNMFWKGLAIDMEMELSIRRDIRSVFVEPRGRVFG